LYSNALKFTDKEGKILVLVEQLVEINKRSIRISVTDSGIGIREEDKEKLFKMFGSLKDEEKKLNLKGIGLGLVISKLIVGRFQGYIDFISEFEYGSTFFYTFSIDDNDDSNNS
jgi:signal transduction histidine kinase